MNSPTCGPRLNAIGRQDLPGSWAETTGKLLNPPGCIISQIRRAFAWTSACLLYALSTHPSQKTTQVAGSVADPSVRLSVGISLRHSSSYIWNSTAVDSHRFHRPLSRSKHLNLEHIYLHAELRTTVVESV